MYQNRSFRQLFALQGLRSDSTSIWHVKEEYTKTRGRYGNFESQEFETLEVSLPIHSQRLVDACTVLVDIAFICNCNVFLCDCFSSTSSW